MPDELDKKIRERALVEEFMLICPDYQGWQFDSYSENPDLIYTKDDEKLGFESIIVTEDQNTVDCYFDPNKCQLNLRVLDGNPQLLELATEVLVKNLFKHIRSYKMPTVLVFSVLNDEIDLRKLAEHFVLPEFRQFNIQDYYLASSRDFVKVSQPI